MKIILLIFLINFFQNSATINTCEIIEVIEENKIVSCPFKENKKLELFFYTKDWPKQWEDSNKLGDVVKVKVIKDIWTPIQSCKVRIAKAKTNHEENKIKEGHSPTNFYIPKDCQ